MRIGAKGRARGGPGTARGIRRPRSLGIRRPFILLSSAFVCWLMLLGALPSTLAEPAPQPDRSSGLAWSLPRVAAATAGEPRDLHLQANGDGTFSAFYEDGGLWHVLVDKSGRPLSTPRFMGTEKPTSWSTHGQPAYSARDCYGDLHMVWDSPSGVHYRKLDSAGKVIVADKVLFGALAHGASLLLDGTSLLAGAVRYEPTSGEYRFAVQRLDLEGAPKGTPWSISPGAGLQLTDGEMVPDTTGGLDVVLAVLDGAVYQRVDPFGNVIERLAIPYLPGGVLPAMVRRAGTPVVLAWNTWEKGSSGRIVAAHVSGSGMESIFITSSTNAVSDPALAVEQGGEAILLWADARTGQREAYHTTVGPQSWDAYPPNLRLPGAGGGFGSAAVSADSLNRVVAAWADGDRIMGARAFSYSFSISSDGGLVHPHGISEMELVLENTGGLADIVHLTLDPRDLPAGWTAALAADEVALPASEGSVTVRIALTGPDNDAGPRHGYLKVTASSAGNSQSEQIVIPVDMEVDHQTEVSLSPSVAQAAPGDNASFELGLKNAGDAAEDLSLEAWSSRGLAVWLGKTRLVLDWAADVRVPVTARVPPDARQGDSMLLELTVRSLATGTARTVHGTIVVVPGVQIWMSAPSGQQNVLPGSTATFAIVVGNAGRSSGSAEVSLEVVSGMDGWSASLDRPGLDLAAGESAGVSLVVVAPPDATGRFVARVVAAASGWDSRASITLTAVAEAVHGLRAAAPLEILAISPGVGLSVPVSVSNNGSSVEEVSAAVLLPAGWTGGFLLGGARLAGPLVIWPGDCVRLAAAIIPPADAPAGNAAGEAQFTSASGASARASFTVSVNQLYEPALHAPVQVLRAAPGDPASAVITVRNRGNGPDTVRLGTETPPGWGAFLSDMDQSPVERLSLPAGGSSTVILQMVAPYMSSDAWSDITVEAASLGGLRARLSFRVGLLLPDLSLGVSYSPQRFAPGKPVLATVTVSNTGEAPARNVVVAFSVDGKGGQIERILLLPASSDKTATFSWTPVAGQHLLRFEVDPDHTVLERDEDNNMFLERVAIAGAMPAAQQVPVAAVAAASATLMLGAVGLAAGGTEGGKYWLAGLLFIPLYTKIKKDDVLDHFVRGQVYGYIKANPGEHYNSIKKALSLKNGTLIYHLKTLENSEFIKSVLDGRFRRFYPKEMKLPEPSEEMVLRMNHIQREMLRIIRENPGISQKEIAERIGLSTATVHYHINIMMSARAIVVRRDGRETRCFVEDPVDGRAG